MEKSDIFGKKQKPIKKIPNRSQRKISAIENYLQKIKQEANPTGKSKPEKRLNNLLQGLYETAITTGDLDLFNETKTYQEKYITILEKRISQKREMSGNTINYQK